MKRSVAIIVSFFLSAIAPAYAADGNAGARLVQTNGCAGCHGAHFEGGVGPKLLGIEHRLSPSRIAAAIANPTAPMPKFPLTNAQIGDVVAYLSNLDGGTNNRAPVATLNPSNPTNHAMLTVRFPGAPPKSVFAVLQMNMSGMGAPQHVALHPTSDRHIWKANLAFSMGGAWTIVIDYDGKHMTLPVNVAGM